MNERFGWMGFAFLASTLCACEPAKPRESVQEARKGAHDDTIRILATVAKRAGIETAAVKSEHLARSINAPAEIVLDPDRTAHLSPLVEAKIEKVVVKLGDHVRAGEVLAVLRSVAVGESRANVAQTDADLQLARAALTRQEELRAAKIGAERTYEEAVAASRRAEAASRAARERSGVVGSYELRAPLAGTVIARHATIGEAVGPQDVLFTVADLAQVWVIGQVYERDVGAVALERAASLTLAAYPERKWAGKISYVAGAVEHETRTLPVHMVLDNPDGMLRPGLFGALNIEASDAIDALAVPSDAVQRVAGKVLLFSREAAPDAEHVAFSPREVTLGRDAGAWVQVLSGVQAGDVIAISGTFTLRGEMLRDTLAEED